MIISLEGHTRCTLITNPEEEEGDHRLLCTAAVVRHRLRTGEQALKATGVV